MGVHYLHLLAMAFFVGGQLVTGLHLLRPRAHLLSAAILLASLTIVWLGLEPAH
jgi:hypothetical protein